MKSSPPLQPPTLPQPPTDPAIISLQVSCQMLLPFYPFLKNSSCIFSVKYAPKTIITTNFIG